VPLPRSTRSGARSGKVVHKLAEEGRIAIRHARTDAIAKVKKAEHVSEDDKRRTDKEVQKSHDDAIHEVEALVKAKEQEIMEV
jgi:ribosome recycling factor